jgi:hypothetical protein
MAGIFGAKFKSILSLKSIIVNFRDDKEIGCRDGVLATYRFDMVSNLLNF